MLITDIKDWVFFSKIIISDSTNKHSIDARPSDAIAIAIRYGCPIFTYEDILSRAGIIISSSKEDVEKLKPEKKDEKTVEPQGINSFSISKLKKLLDQAIEEENYEKASEIRDELKKRKER